MREEIKIKILKNLLEEVTKKYDYFISQRETVLKKTYQMAITDSLTGLYNRYFFIDRLYYEIERSIRENLEFYLIMFDLDNFKPINDKYGHLKGDETLKKIAEILKSNFRSYDTVARLGGDEFIVLASIEKDNIQQRLENIRHEIEKIFPEENLSISYGYLKLPNGLKDILEKHSNKEEIIEIILSEVDSIMYKNKRKKKGLI
ncbi:MAG: GGDEF domain-containing protein [Sulfurihydrogenibium sp.]|uniref:GGDEF domain-containing protein n=1 Tax=Sulfurihydrogenibium sp. TaxID=2053621 RepID=UPI003C7A021A